MAEFSATANLAVVPTGMDAARREIERELGDIDVSVTTDRPTGGAVGATGPEPATVDLSRRQLGELEQIVNLLDQQNDIMAGVEPGGGPGTGSTAAMIEIQRRTLRAQQSSADADVVTNEILTDILDVLEDGDIGGGGGGGFGSGAVTGGLAARGGAGLLSGGGAASGLLAGFGAIFGVGRMLTDPEAARQGRQVPGGRSREVEIPEIPNIDINVPPALQQIADGLGIDINLNSQVDIQMSESLRRSEQQRFEQAADRNNIEPIVRSEVQRLEQRLRRQLGAESGPRTTSRSGGGTGGARLE